jgi:SAM-dependent methyltransferase
LAELRKILLHESKKPPFTIPNERPVEYSFVFRQITRYYPSSVLDVGTGVTALPHLIANCGLHVTAIDNIRDYWTNGMVNRHVLVVDEDVTKMTIHSKYDMVLCISTLEHIVDFDTAVRAMAKSLKPNGTLVMTFPHSHEAFVENVYKLPGTDAPSDMVFGAHSFSRTETLRWERDYGLVKVDEEYWRFFEPGPWTVGTFLNPPEPSSANNPHQIACFAWKKI